MINLRGIGDVSSDFADLQALFTTQTGNFQGAASNLCTDASCLMTGPVVKLTDPALNMDGQSGITDWLVANQAILISVSTLLTIIVVGGSLIGGKRR